MDSASTAATGVRFVIVAAAYNVERYLPEFIASIETQSFDLRRCRVVMVDDGSTDGTARQLAKWRQRRPELVTVRHQTNKGQASARNLGLASAVGEWITFIDPDDFVAVDYLEKLDGFLLSQHRVEMAAANRVLYWEGRDETTPNPLAEFFKSGDHVVNLATNPKYFHVSAPSALFKLDRVLASGLQFNSQVGPHFEDGQFVIRYLLSLDEPLVGFVSSAIYHYRRRADNSSATQRSMSLPARYTSVPKYGFLDVLCQARQQLGYVPEWLQNHILYELRFYLKAAYEPGGVNLANLPEVADTFLELLTEILSYLDRAVIEAFDAQPLPSLWRDILLHAFAGEPWHSPVIHITSVDPVSGLQRLEYRFVGPLPDEDFVVGQRTVVPTFSKVRSVRMFDRTVMRERLLWVPTQEPGTLALWGHKLPQRFGRPDAVPGMLSPAGRGAPASKSQHRQWLSRGQLRRSAWQVRGSLYRKIARSTLLRRQYEGAWALDDGPGGMLRSAEDFFVYLRSHRPEINSWFVAEPGTETWRRLTGLGHGNRLLKRGSVRWQFLLLNAAVLVSSDPDPLAHHPPAVTKLQSRGWRSVFLPATVIQQDLSNALNPKELDLLVSTTNEELQSIVADDTCYRYTAKEVLLIGLPRLDRLREIRRATPVAERDLVILSPGNRDGLLGSSNPYLTAGVWMGGGFDSSVDMDTWVELLRADHFQQALKKRGLSCALMIDQDTRIWPREAIPDSVRICSWSEVDPAAWLARSVVFVTDYSPLAYDADLIGASIVHFQAPAASGPEPSRLISPSPGIGAVNYDVAGAVNFIVEQLENESLDPAPVVDRLKAKVAENDSAGARLAVAIADLITSA